MPRQTVAHLLEVFGPERGLELADDACALLVAERVEDLPDLLGVLDGHLHRVRRQQRVRRQSAGSVAPRELHPQGFGNLKLFGFSRPFERSLNSSLDRCGNENVP